jgi:hypothetical protein
MERDTERNGQRVRVRPNTRNVRDKGNRNELWPRVDDRTAITTARGGLTLSRGEMTEE